VPKFILTPLKKHQKLKTYHKQKIKVHGVDKADGYGHGAVKVALAALQSGADRLGVARLEEAIKIRKASITSPYLFLGLFTLYIPA